MSLIYNDYNIEFAHIYADELFGDSQIESIEILKKLIERLKKENRSYVLTVLIDDYHVTNSNVDVKKLIKEINSYGINADLIGFESKLTKHADNLIKNLPKKMLKIDLFQSPQKEVLSLNYNSHKIGLRESQFLIVRHTCAILSAVWTLSRLGIYKLDKEQIKNLSNKPFVAKNTITILPKKYKSVENKVLKIIESTKFAKLLSRIHYKFY